MIEKSRIDTLPPGLRSYHLAVTDLFVEKALAYLEQQSFIYRTSGVVVNIISFLIISAGAVIANIRMFSPGPSPTSWQPMLWSFTRGFTAYGMIVLLAVALWRFGKALLDQGERLMERRHALRQGRLFVHLHEGPLTIDEMETAFNWNANHSNAFGNIPTEAQAPWGVVLKEMARGLPNAFKAGVDVATKGKIDKKVDFTEGNKDEENQKTRIRGCKPEP